MNRKEFLAYCSNLSEEKLLEIAQVSRNRASGRVSEEMKQLFRTLDDVTECREMFLATDATPSIGVKSHIYVVNPSTNNRNGEKLPVMINVHGGGWSLDHTERDLYFCRRMADRMNCLVVDIDYVLAPEHKYPSALVEMEALFNDFHTFIPQWGGDLEKMVICGQSAGGNLVAAIAQRKKYKPFPGLKAQIICYTPCDNYNDHFHGQELDERGKSTEYYGFFYNRDFEERKNPDVSLLYADDTNLSDLPSTDIIIAGIDNLVEEQYKYYELLKTHGTPVTCKLFEKSRHGFVINLYDEWKEGEDYIAGLLEKYFI